MTASFRIAWGVSSNDGRLTLELSDDAATLVADALEVVDPDNDIVRSDAREIAAGLRYEVERRALARGKFEGCSDPVLAKRLYEITLDGGHESAVGSVDESGWYALVGDSETAGFYIIREDSDGFVTIEHGPVEMHTADRLWRSYEEELGG